MNGIDRSITEIAVCGYKSIYQKSAMELGPLTVLAGANSSGKSSMLQPVLLLKQTLENPFDPGVFRLNGPNVRFTSADQLLSKVPGEPESDSFSLTFSLNSMETLCWTYRKVGGEGFKIESQTHYGAGAKIELAEGLTHEEIQAMLPASVATWLASWPPARPGKEWRWEVYRERCFLALAQTQKTAPDKRRVFDLDELSPGAMVTPEIKGLIHVPGLRGNPERTYTKTTLVGPDFPGTFENYVASVVSQWKASDRARLEQLGEWLQDLGMTWKVDARSVDDTRIEVRVGRLLHGRRGGTRDMVNVADVGFGVSQILPVLVALLAARPGQLVYLEEPEIHLHPQAQRRLAGLLASASRRGVRVIVETHSALLLREIQTLVARGKLEPDMVKLHWFKRSQADGITELVTADLDAKGAYGDWPEDFDEVHLASEKAYLDAVEEKAG